MAFGHWHTFPMPLRTDFPRRNGYKSFGELRGHLAQLKVKNAVIDGEVVCLDAEGRSIFNELPLRKGFPIFYAFDLLYLNNRDLRQLPLLERKEKLRSLIEKGGLPDVICGKYVEEPGVDLFNEVCPEFRRRCGKTEKRNLCNGKRVVRN
jgi:ATP-dependent DNA ligase